MYKTSPLTPNFETRGGGEERSDGNVKCGNLRKPELTGVKDVLLIFPTIVPTEKILISVSSQFQNSLLDPW